MWLRFGWVAAICGAPGLALAQVADGTYEVGQCTEAGSEGRVTVAGDTISFHESNCQLTYATNVREMAGAILYDAVCSGEGEAWTRRMMLMQGPSGRLVIVQPGFATTYQSCD